MEMIYGSRKLVVLTMAVVVAMVVMFEGSSAQTFCNLTQQELETCKPAVTPPNPADPTGVCCDVLNKKADLSCLCKFKNSFELRLLGIDPDLAMELPKKCNVDTPPDC